MVNKKSWFKKLKVKVLDFNLYFPKDISDRSYALHERGEITFHLIYNMFISLDKLQRYSSFTKSVPNHCSLTLSKLRLTKSQSKKE